LAVQVIEKIKVEKIVMLVEDCHNFDNDRWGGPFLHLTIAPSGLKNGNEP
jgi:hypothetical protein